VDEQILEWLKRASTYVILATVDSDGYPSAIPLGSLVAHDARHVSFTLRRTARSLANIERNPSIGILVLGATVRASMKARVTGFGASLRNSVHFGVEMTPVHAEVVEVTPVAAIVESLPLQFWSWNAERVEALCAVRAELRELHERAGTAGTMPD